MDVSHLFGSSAEVFTSQYWGDGLVSGTFYESMEVESLSIDLRERLGISHRVGG